MVSGLHTVYSGVDVHEYDGFDAIQPAVTLTGGIQAIASMALQT